MEADLYFKNILSRFSRERERESESNAVTVQITFCTVVMGLRILEWEFVVMGH